MLPQNINQLATPLISRLHNRLRLLRRRILPRAIARTPLGTFRVDLRTEIGNRLYYNKDFEGDAIDVVTKVAKMIKGETLGAILDIGANIGVHSIRWATTANPENVYAFEPCGKTRNDLEYNIRLNRVEKCVASVPLAVSEFESRLPFFETTDNAYNSLKDTRRKGVVKVSQVTCTTIDAFVRSADIRKLDIVKIDVEGLETEVIRGGVLSLRVHMPILFVEIYKGDNSNPNPTDTIRLLTEIGYEPHIIDGDKLLPYTRHDDDLYNYIFIPPMR